MTRLFTLAAFSRSSDNLWGETMKTLNVLYFGIDYAFTQSNANVQLCSVNKKMLLKLSRHVVTSVEKIANVNKALKGGYILAVV